VPGFLREHATPILASLVLHAFVIALIAGGAYLAVPERPEPVRTIQGFVVRDVPPGERAPATPPPGAPVAEPVAEPVPEPTPEPEVEPEPSAPDPAAVAKREAQEREAARKVEAEAAARRKAEAAAAEKRREEAEARKLAEAQRRKDAAAKQLAEAKRREEAEARRRAEAERAIREAREADLARRLAAEDARASAQAAGLLDRYVAELQARVERAWNRPPSAQPGLRCTVHVTQVPGGTVTDVRVGDCNGDDAVRQSIVFAVYHASPLPAPPDPSLFERRLTMVFAPDD
jgi:colicin import membrane protein